MVKTTTATSLIATPDLAATLTSARMRLAVKEADAVMREATQRGEAHLLAPDDLAWLVEKLGAFESSWGAGHAIAHWLFHHGPVHPQLVATAVNIAEYDDAEWLDDVLLWIEPTPHRWLQQAAWSASLTWRLLRFELRREGRAVPTLEAPTDIALYKAQALTEPADFPRHVLAERGDGARRSLRAAPELAIPGRDVRLILEAWAAGLT
jgi:hypothetical protein